ncbi:MAG TPA: hypothetical protein GX497_01825 [Bacillus bacterium]|nr:hypothetical protein [Bacillus sp. (in: firmicutes)]
MDLAIKNIKLIKPNALNSKISMLETKKLFQDVKEFLKKELNKDLVNFEHQGISFDVNLESNEKVEIHVLEDSRSLVSLIFGLISRPDGKTLETARLSVVVEDSKTTILDINYEQATKKFVVGTEFVEDTIENTWKTIKEKNRSGLIEDLETDPIKAQDFGDTCLPGGYQYCGQQCGTNGSAGGGGPIYNKVDGCCYIHDECYKKHKTNRCSNCDQALVDCVNTWNNYKEGPVAATSISSFFIAKCGFIIV